MSLPFGERQVLSLPFLSLPFPDVDKEKHQNPAEVPPFSRDRFPIPPFLVPPFSGPLRKLCA